MTPELWQKVQSAWDEFFDTPSERQPSFLDELRAHDTEVSRELEALLEQREPASAHSLPAPPKLVLERVIQQCEEPLPQNPETVDYVSQANSVADKPKADSQPQDDLELPTKIGRYPIDRKLGEGGMGIVFRGRDPDLNRYLAVKVLKQNRRDDADMRRRFLEEAQIMGQLQHPGVAPIHEIGALADGRPFFSMKQIQGRTLAEMLNRRDQESGIRSHESGAKKPADGVRWDHRDLPRFIAIFEQICQTLAYAHSQGIIHRDLKPANVMVGAFGEVQVMDWGLAKLVSGQWSVVSGSETPGFAAKGVSVAAPEGGSPSDKLRTTDQEPRTRAGIAMGTPAYMAPEQARGEISKVDQRADVFGMGAILCTILTGKPPFWSMNRGDVIGMARRGDLDDAFARLEPCGADSELIDLCKKCLAPKKEDRPQDGGEVAEALAAHQAAVREKLRRAELDRAKAQVRRRWATVAAAALILLITGVAVGTLAYQQWTLTRAAAHVGLQNDMRNAVERAESIRAALLEQLDKEKESRHLINRPTVWLAQITGAREALQRAKDMRKGAERAIDPGLLAEIQDLHKKLRQDEIDLKIGRALDKAREHSGLFVDGKFDFPGALTGYRAAFELAGLNLDDDAPDRLAVQIGRSPIRRLLLAALDDFFYVAAAQKKMGLVDRLHQTLRQGDPDPWRNRLRQRELWNNRLASEKLVREYLADPANLSKLPVQTLALMGNVLPHGSDIQLELLRQAHLVHPDDFWLAFDLANALNTRKKHEQAIGYFRAALAVRPLSAIAWNNLGNALADAKDMPGAIDAYEKAISINKRYPQPWYNLGQLHRGRKELPAAIDAYRNALAIDSSIIGAWINLGSALRLSKDFPGAFDAYKKALAIDKMSKEAWMNLGMALRDSKDLRGAIDAYKKAIGIDDEFAEAWYHFGIAHRARNDLPAAIDAYKKALAIDNQFAEAWNNLGNVHRDTHDLPAAIDAYKKAVTFDKQSALAWTNLGVALREMSDLRGAIDAYKKALAIDNQYAKAWLNLGAARFAGKDLPAAIDAFNKALAIDPQYAHAHANLGLVLRDRGEFKKAVASLQKAVKCIAEGHPARYSMLYYLKQCQQLVQMKQRLPVVLKGKNTIAAEQLQLANLCQRYLRRYCDAAKLYTAAFAAEPKRADDLRYGHRYDAACAAALAAAGKDAGKLGSEDQTKLRRQALGWLRADLSAYRKLVEAKPQAAVMVAERMGHWQKDADLASLWDVKPLAAMAAVERKQWQQLWSDVVSLRKKARARYTEAILKGNLTNAKREQPHEAKLTAGKTYVIDMQSKQFDTLLRLHDAKGNKLAEIDDIGPGKNLNSRITFTPKQTGVYRLIATSYQQKGRGDYELIIREFPAIAKKTPTGSKPPPPPKNGNKKPNPNTAIKKKPTAPTKTKPGAQKTTASNTFIGKRTHF